MSFPIFAPFNLQEDPEVGIFLEHFQERRRLIWDHAAWKKWNQGLQINPSVPLRSFQSRNESTWPCWGISLDCAAVKHTGKSYVPRIGLPYWAWKSFRSRPVDTGHLFLIYIFLYLSFRHHISINEILVWIKGISGIWDQPSRGESGQGRMENVFHCSLFKYFQVKLTNLEMPWKDNQNSNALKEEKLLRYMSYLFPFICISCPDPSRKRFLTQTFSAQSPSQKYTQK